MGEHTGPVPAGPLIERVDAATARLIASAAVLSEEQIRQTSLLPGWTRGHVLTHVARNADSLVNLLTWAHTGVQTPQYRSQEARDAAIEAGAGRPGSEIRVDLSRSAQAFSALARELPPGAWLAEVRAFRGPAHPAWFTLHRRLSEVEIHHVDLAAGYTPADWPDDFVAEMLDRVAGGLAQDGSGPPAMLVDAGGGRRYDLRRDVAAEVTVTGRGSDLLAWLIGRSDGRPLSADPPGPLPEVPPF